MGKIIGGVYVEDPENKTYAVRLWKCHCGVKNPVTFIRCESCGAGMGKRGSLLNEYRQVTDEQSIYLIDGEPQLQYCGSCDQLYWSHDPDTQQLLNSCISCGDNDPKLVTIFEEDQEPEVHERPIKRRASSTSRSRSFDYAIRDTIPDYTSVSSPWFRWQYVIGGMVVVLLVAAFCWGVVWYAKKRAERNPVAGVLTGVYWKRSVPIQNHQRTDSSTRTLCANVPSGAKELRRYDETTSGTRKTGRQIEDRSRRVPCPKQQTGKGATVTTGTECYALVDEVEPYTKTETFCDWELWEWVVIRTPMAEEHDHRPYWPTDSKLSSEERYENGALEDSPQTYRAYFVDRNGTRHQLNLSLSVWRQLDFNAEFTLLLDGFGDLAEYQMHVAPPIGK